MKYRSTDFLYLAGLALAYALLAKVALGFFSADGFVSIVWPPSGLALAALLIYGRKYWPGVFIGALAGNFIAGSTIAVSTFIAAGNTLEALAGVWLLARLGRFDAGLTRPQDFFLLGLAGALSACVSAVLGIATLWLTDLLAPSMIIRNLLLWWQGDTLGIILLTPLLLVWRQQPQDWLGRMRTVECIACFGLAFLAGQIIFLGWFHELFGAVARGFWMFLFVVWGAARFGRHGALLILGMTAVQMSLGTVMQSKGFINNLVPTGELNFWFYMMALTVTGVSLALGIDRRKHAEGTLRQSEERLRLVLDGVGPQMFVGLLDTAGVLLLANRPALAVAGLSMEDVLGKPVEDTYWLSYSDAVRKRLQAAVRRAANGEVSRYDEQIRVAEGQYIWIDFCIQPLRDETGKIAYLVPSAIAIDERKQAEMKLAASESRLHNIIDTEPECVKLVAADGSLLEMNSAGLRMIEADSFRQVENLCIYPLVAEQHRLAFMELNEKVFAGGSGTLEFQVVGLKGGQRWLETHASPLRDESGCVTALLGVTRDITERKLAEARVQRLSKLYRALSQINLAIVRMGQQEELFPLVCRCAVEFGGMTLAWVGRVDKASSLILPVASYGEGLAYLENVQISSRAEVPEGCGPTGTALRENRSIIINDYFADPMTVPWQAQAAGYAWGSAASFPIQRGGKPFAVLSVYHAQINAFDEEAITLLDEMSKDISFALDNFDREAQRKVGEESLRLAASVYESSSEAIMVTDADELIIAVNPAFTAITGYGAEEVIGKNPSLLNSGRHDEMFYQAMWREINTTGKWQGEIWDRRKNGEVYPKWLTINTVFQADGSVLRRIALFTDITQKKESDELIWRQANFDALTALPNRQMFHDRLDQDLKKAYRSNLPLALMLLDLDGFKEINDTLGHDMGDALLKETARRLASCVRETDTVARLGGDEFTVIMGELEDASSVERVAQEILRKLAEPYRLRDEIAYVSASIGITLYPEDATVIDELIKHADQAMYAAKNKGRNRYQYFTSAMQEAAQNRMRVTRDLRGALAGRQLWVAYQPIVELTTGVVRKAEALVRWQHPTRGLVSPAEFIPFAEDSGLIIDIGNWVFREAAQQVKHWRNILHPDFQISVNKSPVQFHNVSHTHMDWYDYLKQLDLPGQSISVEITEGLLLDANPVVTSHLLEFRDAGMQVSLDDFGTGYSSLSYLKKFDIDYLKIDQSFVRHLSAGSDDMALCSAIIEMAHKLGLLVIAEGVETEQQKTLLEQIGCDFAQGYLYSRPVPAQAFEKLYS